MILKLFPFAAYTWNVEFPEDRHLIKSQSRRKQYYFHYYQTGTTYGAAKIRCQDKGAGWDLANFQAVTRRYGNYNNKALMNVM